MTSNLRSAEPDFGFDPSRKPARLLPRGTFRIRYLPRLEEIARRLRGGPLANQEAGEIVFDLSDLADLDTAGAWLILDLRDRMQAEGWSPRLEGASELQKVLFDTVAENMRGETTSERKRRGFRHWLEVVGRWISNSGATTMELLSLLGAIVARIAGVALRPWRLRWTSLTHHVEAVGFDAIPIVSLMSFLIGVVLAFQGAVQLRQFGAEIFVVDLISIAVLRELGVLLTAIIVAGRSGSAFTAAVGSMKMREEIDAMRTLGLDPVSVLVVPRVLALMIALPILTFIADMAGLLGGAMMSWIELGVSPGMFVARMLAEIDVWQFVVGMVKAPFFAITIALVGCYEGLKVEGNAESLGSQTSRSVVEAIFLVILLDALFSVFFALVGV